MSTGEGWGASPGQTARRKPRHPMAPGPFWALIAILLMLYMLSCCGFILSLWLAFGATGARYGIGFAVAMHSGALFIATLSALVMASLRLKPASSARGQDASP